ncbi:exo-alpha-sialidase [Paenibacillus hemerocallicola]|uniref:Exo-alpha-sialidase n=1 Tax=Paenibacillus hemerocallicola TaxID=1172614 RepID=A0A5C4T589_9BACL|nr:glycoside hydrolase [Paenibacillus hemerocallicola]TNJ63359.1 exo-alpha-sialidase [Paenibacillus hemerocallicola]
MNGNLTKRAWNSGGQDGWTGEFGSLANALHIDRVAPGDGEVQISWRLNAKGEGDRAPLVIEATLQPEGGESVIKRFDAGAGYGNATISNLKNGIDYRLHLTWITQDGSNDPVVGPVRLFRCGHVPGTIVNYIHPEDRTYDFSGRSTASPSIVKLPDGRLVVSHDVFWMEAGQNLSMIFSSDDNGRAWRFINYLSPCFWGKLFVHCERLYMLGTSTEYGDLLIGCSEDGGNTWSAPTILMKGGTRETGGPHKAPMPVIVHRNRIWTSIDYGAWKSGGHRTGMLSAPIEADLLDSASWTVTPFLPYDPQWPGAISGGSLPNLLEGNAVVAPDGRLAVIPRYQTIGGLPSHGRTIVLYADAEHPDAPLVFGKTIDFHGNMSKFTVQFDERSQKYWSLVSRVTGANAGQRNVLALVRSSDMEHWEVVRDVLNYEDNGWPENDKQVGFQYADWIADGDDLLFVSRTALNGAHNFHDANYITFHRVPSFRDQAATGGLEIR